MKIIRHWSINDATDLAVAINNKKVQDNLRDGIPFPYTKTDAEFYITSALAADKNKCFTFAIVSDDKVIGSIGVYRKENIHYRTGELGYYISEPYWGKGIATEAIKQICDYIFENTDIIRVFAEPFADNIASCRVLEKADFEFEGLLRQNAFKNGQLKDMKLFAKIKK